MPWSQLPVGSIALGTWKYWRASLCRTGVLKQGILCSAWLWGNIWILRKPGNLAPCSRLIAAKWVSMPKRPRQNVDPSRGSVLCALVSYTELWRLERLGVPGEAYGFNTKIPHMSGCVSWERLKTAQLKWQQQLTITMFLASLFSKEKWKL